MRIADDVHRALRIRAAETGETMEDILDRALRRELDMMVYCEICGAGGLETPATKKVLGKDACDQCAAELETALQIGPAIWMVEVSDGEEYEGYEEADYGTIDFGPYTLGWRDREAAEAYAQRAGAEVREGFVVRVIGGDVGDALEAAGIADGAGFDGPAGVVWPHDDEEGLRKRLLYGTDA